MRLRHVLGGIALSLFSLLGASQAFAQADPCAGPFPGPNVSIVKSGDCTISSEINVAGTVSIQITGGSLTDASNIAGGSVSISQSGGTTTLAGLASSGAINVSSDGALSIGSVSSQSGVTASSGNSDINVGGAIYVEGAVQLTANNGKINAQTITANFQPVTLSSSGTLTTGAVNAPSADVTATSTNGDIDVTGDINAQGAVKLTAANGKIAAQAINSGGNLVSLNADSIQGTSVSAGAYVYAKSTTGSIKFSGDVTANTSGVGFGIQLYAQGDLSAGNLSEAGTNGGFVDIWSNMGGASSPFTIGGSGNTNGINGTITATGASSNRNGLLVQNGTASSTGDITITNGSNINVTNTGAQSGSIWISANQGTVTIQGGTLSADGSGTQAGGGVVLIGNTISAPSGAVLSARQSPSVSGSTPQIWLAATNINFGGSGLTADTDGSYGQIFVYPAGTLSVTTNMDTTFLIWNLSANYSVTGSVSFNGTGSPLNLTANGTNGTLFVETPQGNITFDAGPISLTANGTNGDLYVNPGIGGVTFNSAENPITLTANGTNGQVDVWSNTANITFNGSNNPLTLTANGDNGQINVGSTSGNIDFNNPGGAISLSANGNNTRVNVNGYPLTFTGASLSVTANGNSSNFIGLGVGNNTQTGSDGINFDITGATVIDASAAAGQSSGNINIWEDQVTINGTSFAMMVNGPSSGDGNAGALSLLWANTILNPATAASFSANGPSSGNGNGGSITYWPGAPTIAFGSSAGQLSFAAKGGGATGNGGSITVAGSDMSFNGTQAGSMDVSVPGTTGDGGTINVSGGNITFSGTGYTLAADAGTQQGSGGNITLSPFAAMTIGNTSGGVVFSAKGQGTGNGGSVTASGLPLTVNGANIDVSAGTASGSNGNGGQINLTSNFTFGSTWLSGNLVANGNGSGNGGSISITTDSAITFDNTTQLIAQSLGAGNGGTVNISSQGAITIGDGSILVTPTSGSNGNGGTVSIVSTATGLDGLITFNGDVDVSGDGTGSGGNITVSGDSLQFNDAQLTADGGDNGSGGAISITTTDTNAASYTSSGVISATGGSSAGNGGNFTINTAGDLTLDPSSFDLAAGDNGNGGSVSITSAGNLTIDDSLTVAGGCDSGDGGTVNIQAQVLDTQDIVADAGGDCSNAMVLKAIQSPRAAPTSNGGHVHLTATQLAKTFNHTYSAKAKADGNGGEVLLTLSAGEPTITGATLHADGGPSGNGGSIEIKGTGAGPINLDSTTIISANAGASATSGVGGSITIQTDDDIAIAGSSGANAPALQVTATGNGNGGNISVTSTTGAVTVSGNLNADGAGNGSGGTLALSAGTTDPNRPLNVDGAILSASAGATGTGNGGQQLQLSNAAGLIVIGDATINAKSGSAGGNGGNVKILTGTTSGLEVNVENSKVNVSGAPVSGSTGGTVEINKAVMNNASTYLTPVSIFNVNGGVNNQNGGSVKLNNVKCQEVGNGSFPQVYWNCTGSTGGNQNLPAQQAAALPSSFVSLLNPVLDNDNMQTLQVFVFANASDLGAFLAAPPSPDYVGLTSLGRDGHMYSSIALGTLNAANVKESSNHEFGHAYDDIHEDQPSHDPNYAKAVSNDLLTLDYNSRTTFTKATAVPPCSSGGTAPFDGLTDQNGNAICQSDHTINPAYATWTNSKILQQLTPYPNLFATGTQAVENYAQAFSQQQFVFNTTKNSGKSYLFLTYDGLAAKNPTYFGCTQYVASLLAGTTVVQPTYCASTIPASYQPYQNLPEPTK